MPRIPIANTENALWKKKSKSHSNDSAIRVDIQRCTVSIDVCKKIGTLSRTQM